MVATILIKALTVAALCPNIQGFSTFGSGRIRFGVATRTAFSSTSIHSTETPMPIISQFFQLEELEDKETTTTEIFIADDSSLSFGETDGPPPAECTGSWEMLDDDTIKLTVARRFEAGREGKETDMGEFAYDVVRSYTGSFMKVGAKVAVTGIIHQVDDEVGDMEVGFFNMIDTTEEKMPKDE